MAWQDGGNFAIGGFNMAQAMAAQQGRHLAGMANQVNDVIADEMDSRRALAREQERMDYQRWLAEQQLYLQWGKLANDRAMQQDQAANEIRVLKYRAAQDRRARDGIVRRSLRRDPVTGSFRWMEDWEA